MVSPPGCQPAGHTVARTGANVRVEEYIEIGIFQDNKGSKSE